MISYLLRRIPTAIVVLFVASLLIFSVLRLVPGSPAAALAGPDASPADLAAIQHDLGLDRGFFTQYFSWLGHLLTGDLGRSYAVGGSVRSLVGFGLTNTVVLTVTALVIAVVLAFSLALTGVLYDNRVLRGVLTAVNALAIALPTFVVGTTLILLFSIHFRLLPAGGTPPKGFTDSLQISAQYLILPALTLGLPTGALLARFLTEALRTELNQPYAVTARALGATRRDIVLKHALRNALPPTLTALGLSIGGLLGGAVLVESIFGWPGLGLLTEESIFTRDYPLVQVLVLLSVTVFVIIQLLADVLHAWIDPRIRLAGSR